MLRKFYPSGFQRYSELAILGPVTDDLTAWLSEHGYACGSIMQLIWRLPHIETILRRRGVRRCSEITEADLAACRKALMMQFPGRKGHGAGLERYLRAQGLVRQKEQKATKVTAGYVNAFSHYLKTVRGASGTTIRQNVQTASHFLTHIRIDASPDRLKNLTINDLEGFVKKTSERLSRASLKTIVSRVRVFLRFLAVKGKAPRNLACQIDSPRVYREEQLPRTLPWETVRAFLKSIDRSNLSGLRDFTMFSLMATYGLRASDVAALTLDDIHWRDGRICITQRKTGQVLDLPLTDAAGTALHTYIKVVPPLPPFRQIFLRVRAPMGPLTTAAICNAFWRRVHQSGVNISGQGACHRIRHSYAVFLLRRGTSVKTIGDILGHRTLESTATYLRLAIEDLRDVALPVPQGRTLQKAVRP